MSGNSDYLSRTKKQYFTSLFLSFMASNVLIIAGWATLRQFFHFSDGYFALILAAEALIFSLLFALNLTSYLSSPIKAFWQLILHLTPTANQPAPNIDSLKIGRELLANLTMEVYQLTSTNGARLANSSAEASKVNFSFIVNNLPLPLFILDPDQTIVIANKHAADYINQPLKELVGKNFYMVMDMSFPSDNTLDKWLRESKAKVATASNSWERVRLNVLDNHPTLLFDLAAYYNKDNPDRYETLIILFDHTKQYSQDEQAVSFVALSVHELRTPLTLLRGYIEVLEDELGKNASPELASFIQKMSATAQQLNAFVNNILNVARVDNDQLQLQLEEEDWGEIVLSAVNAISLRAEVRGISIKTSIAPNLPKVGVDRLSIYEVINNLVDNAIKYSSKSTKIEVDAHLNREGQVETTIKDYGVGISENIMPNLFTKFYRDHRNRSQIGGTGLGLYLAKAVIEAHGGSIWVKSKIGEGSTFGFTLQPYAQLAEELKNSNNKEIVRGAHGWIKNHSLYRR